MKYFRKFKEVIVPFLKQGTSVYELAITIALGVMIGMFPVQGTTTLICTLVAIIFRLNLVVIQLANYLSFPLMMITLVPYYVIGNELFNTTEFTWTTDELLHMFRNDFFSTIQLLSKFILYAILVWIISAPLGIAALYYITLPVLKHLNLREKKSY